jgi:hypothetical protein
LTLLVNSGGMKIIKARHDIFFDIVKL